jgi:hypothetical protein
VRRRGRIPEGRCRRTTSEGDEVEAAIEGISEGHAGAGRFVGRATRDDPASDQWFSSGMLVIEGSFQVDHPGGGA